MLPNLANKLVGGEPILSKTISLRTLESEIAKPLKQVQEKNKDVDIGSYPFFRKGKIGISIVIRCKDQSKIENCSSQIFDFIKEKNIEIVERE
jgi:molybdopterin-biosynthesis enzyme MoeA-like protein